MREQAPIPKSSMPPIQIRAPRPATSRANILSVVKAVFRFSGHCRGTPARVLYLGEARLSRSLVSPREPLASISSWVIEYGTLLVDCRDEDDAKTIVRGLRYRGGLVARTAIGVSPGRRIEGADLASWLSG